MIVLIGNCQLDRLQYILMASGFSNLKYYSNTSKLDNNFDVENVLNACKNADLVISQPIIEKTNPLNYEVLASANKNTIFVPYIFIDGYFSLSSSDINSNKIYGEECLDTKLIQHDFGFILESFKKGNLDFNLKSRLSNSIQELKNREDLCQIIISDVIEQQILEIPLLISHNHPSPYLFDIFVSRIFDLLETKYKPFNLQSAAQRIEYVFGTGSSVYSVYDAKALNSRNAFDDQWFNIGHMLLASYRRRLNLT